MKSCHYVLIAILMGITSAISINMTRRTRKDINNMWNAGIVTNTGTLRVSAMNKVPTGKTQKMISSLIRFHKWSMSRGVTSEAGKSQITRKKSIQDLQKGQPEKEEEILRWIRWIWSIRRIWPIRRIWLIRWQQLLMKWCLLSNRMFGNTNININMSICEG